MYDRAHTAATGGVYTFVPSTLTSPPYQTIDNELINDDGALSNSNGYMTSPPRISSRPWFPSRRKKHSTSSEIELVNVDPTLDLSNEERSQIRAPSHWSVYNPFFIRFRRSRYGVRRPTEPATSHTDDTSDTGVHWSSALKGLTGWRAGTRICCLAVVVCVIIETVLLIWAVVMDDHRASDGFIYQGSCDTVRKLEVWLLLPLNIAATVLIGTSNYVMQVMSAPNRQEIDQAHRWAMSIAVGGIRFKDLRFGKAGKARRVIWWSLVLSSLPIHLLLNAAFYGSVQVSNTGVLVVSEDFADDSTWSQCDKNLTDNSIPAEFACFMKESFAKGNTTQLTASQCYSQYTRGFQTNASSLIVVTNTESDRWYSSPQSVRLPDDFGIACRYKNNDTYDVEEVPDSERVYNFTYNPAIARAEISLDFYPFCTNITHDHDHGSYSTWSLDLPTSSSSQNLDFVDVDAILLTEKDAVSNISSIRTLFTALDYKYWSIAQVTGDYLSQGNEATLGGWDLRSWLCDATVLVKTHRCDLPPLQVNQDWKITPAAYSVKECHVIPMEENCSLRYSLKILIITLCCDLAKLVAMISALRTGSRPLTTLGDIIESFLQNPDPYTENMCLLDDATVTEWVFRKRDNIIKAKRVDARSKRMLLPTLQHDHNVSPPFQDATELQPSSDPQSSRARIGDVTGTSYGCSHRWAPKRKRWVTVPSHTRWIIWRILYGASTLFLVGYLGTGISSLQKQGITQGWTIGFGGPDPRTLLLGWLGGTKNITWAAAVVNMPQVLFTSMYFMFNATLTEMHTAHEWGLFTEQRKTLRVTSPKGQQRSTYWLQLPWSYSVPLIVASGSLHWLLGRSLYLIRADVSDYFNTRREEKDFFACGYTVIAVMLQITILTSIGIAIGTLSRRTLPGGAPVVGLNSLAIAAACHPDPAEEDIGLKPLMWGVVDVDGGNSNGVPHCSFSAREVTSLRKDVVYQ